MIAPLSCRGGRTVVVGDSRQAAELADRALVGLPVILTKSLTDQLIERSACLLLHQPTSRRLEETMRSVASVGYPRHQVLVVTHQTDEVLRALADVGLLGHAIWLPQDHAAIRERVVAIARPHFLDKALDLLSDASVPDGACRFFMVAWTSNPPAQTVSEAISVLDAGESVIRDQWHSAGLDIHLKEVIDWGVLGRAVAERTDGASWTRVAIGLHTNDRHLRRIARRLLDASLTELDAMGMEGVAKKFWRWYGANLTRSRGSRAKEDSAA